MSISINHYIVHVVIIKVEQIEYQYTSLFKMLRIHFHNFCLSYMRSTDKHSVFFNGFAKCVFFTTCQQCKTNELICLIYVLWRSIAGGPVMAFFFFKTKTIS